MKNVSQSLARAATWHTLLVCTALAAGLLPVAAVGELRVGQAAVQALQSVSVDVGDEALRMTVPSTWRQFVDGGTVILAPEDGQGQAAGKAHVTHGIEFEVQGAVRHDLSGAFEDVVQQLMTANPALRAASTTRLQRLAGRLGLRNTFASMSLVTGRPEFVVIVATPLDRGRALYVLGVAPDRQFQSFRQTFEQVLQSIERAR